MHEIFNNVIDIFGDKNGYISDIKSVINFLVTNNCTYEDIIMFLIMIYNKNYSIYLNIKKENENFNIMKQLEDKKKNSNKEMLIVDPLKNELFIDQIDSNDIYYNSYIIPISSDMNSDIIKEILPDKNNPNYYNIAIELLFYYRKELIKYIKNNDNERIKITKSLLNQLKDEIKNISKDKVTQDNSKKYNILYSSEKILNVIDEIPQDFYKEILELINGMKAGSSTNQKLFKPIGGKYLIYEERGYRVRILYDIINNNTFCIYHMFIKGEQNEIYHKRLIENSTKYNEIYKPNMIEYAKNNKNDFLEEQKIINELVEEKLLQSKKQEKKI